MSHIPSSKVGGISAANKLARLNSDGKLAASFGGGADEVAILDGDGKLPVGNAAPKSVYITGGAEAIAPGDIGAVTAAELNAAINGLDPKANVRIATTTNITLSNEQTLQSVALSAGDRVLVAGQTDATTNGIYDVVDGGAWTRSTDCDVNAEVTSGLSVFVSEGTNAGKQYFLTTVDPIVVGTTELLFSVFSSLQLSDAAPEDLADTASAGVSASAARADHVHSNAGLLLLSGASVMEGNLDMGSNQIVSLAAGTQPDHAANVSQATGGMTIYNASTISTTATLEWGKAYLCDTTSSNFTVTLPDAAALSNNLGRKIKVWNIGTGVLTIAPAASNTINGSASSFTLEVQYESADLMEIGNNAVLSE